MKYANLKFWKVKFFTTIFVLFTACSVSAFGLGDIGGMLGGGGGGSGMSGTHDNLTASLQKSLTHLTMSQKIIFQALDMDVEAQVAGKLLEGLKNEDFGTKDSIDKVYESSAKLTAAQSDVIAKKAVLGVESKALFITSIPHYIKGVMGSVKTAALAVEAGKSIASLGPTALMKLGALISIVSKAPDLLSQLGGTTSSMFEFMGANDIDTTDMKQQIKF